MQCPSCRLINPDTAHVCDCGYSFHTRSKPTLVPAAPALKPIQALFLADVIATLGAVVPSVVSPSLATGLLRDVGVLAHIGLATIALILTRRRLAAASMPSAGFTVAYAVTILFCFPIQWALLWSKLRELARQARAVTA